MDITVTNVACYGGSTGSITVMTGLKNYNRDNGSTWQPSNVFSGLIADSYNIRVESENGCISDAIPVTISQPEAALDGLSTVINSVCNGGTGTITIDASGGTPSYNYKLNTDADYKTGNTFTVPAGTNYSVTIRDNNNCEMTITGITVTQPEALNAGTIGSAQTICYGATPATFSQSSAPSGGMGTGTYTYKWQSSTDDSNWSDISPAATDATYTHTTALTANTYFRRAVTSGSCGTEYSSPVTVTVNALPNAPAADNIMKCYDGTTYTAGATVGADQTVVWYAAESGTNPASEPSRSAVGTTTAYAAAKITATGCESAARTAVYVHIVEKFVAPDIRLQICTSPPGRTVQLTSYLDSTDYDKVQWEQVSPYPLVSNTETGLITDGYFHENSIYTYKYTLLSPEYSGCGSTSAQVYIRPQSNRIFGKTVDTITICSALAVSRFVNLNQIFGLELGGVWSYPNDDPACIAQNNVTQSISPSKYAGAMVFNAQNAYAEAETNDNYSIIYKGTPAKKFDFVYTASCVTATKRVTLIVTE
jgi:hypothetical protein